MGDGRLVSVFVSRDVFVQVGQAAGGRLGDVAQLVPGHDVGLQVVGKGALLTHREVLVIKSPLLRTQRSVLAKQQPEISFCLTVFDKNHSSESKKKIFFLQL